VDAWTFASLPESTTDYLPVIAVDPGKHTGVANLGVDGAVFAGEGDWFETLDYVQQACHRYWEAGQIDGLTLVWETFTITQQTATNTQAPWSLEAIGAMRFLARRYGIATHTQLPVEAKKFATMNRLKHQGWWKSTPGGHCNDALRHLYLYLANRHVLIPPAGVV
jgi:hypothetical protein